MNGIKTYLTGIKMDGGSAVAINLQPSNLSRTYQNNNKVPRKKAFFAQDQDNQACCVENGNP